MTGHHDQQDEHDQHDQHVRVLLLGAVGDVRSPVTAPAALAAGHRRLRHRRLVAVGGGAFATAASLALVATLTTGAAPGQTRGIDVGATTGGTGGTTASTGVPTSETASSPSSASDTTPPLEDPAWSVRPAAEVRDRLAALLPDGIEVVDAQLVNDDAAPGESTALVGRVVVVLQNAAGEQGKAELDLRGFPPPPGTSRLPSGSTGTPGTPGTPSSPSSVEGSSADPSTGRDPAVGVVTLGEITVVTVAHVYTDGWVRLSVTNTLDRKWGEDSPPSAPAPLLTQRQAQSVVDDPSWLDG